jgi:uncharacterized membrane protein
MNRNQNTPLIIGGVILAILVFLILGFLLFWGFRGADFGMMSPGMMGDYGTMFLVPIIIIIILGLIVWAALSASQKSSVSNDATEHKTETPLDILKLRYARGEMGKEE